jgi:hypothetical protein
VTQEEVTTEEELENDVTSYVPTLDPFTKAPLLEPLKVDFTYNSYLYIIN